MAAKASSRPKQQWRPSRGREQSRDMTDLSGNQTPSEAKDSGLENVALPSPSSSSTKIDSSSSGSSLGTYASVARTGTALKTAFVPYLPQDDAVAAGLDAENGGIDAMETQRVADLLNEELGGLLRMQPMDFWKAVTMDASIEVSLDSYLQFRRRSYDLQFNRSNTELAGMIVGDELLLRRVFMVLYRMSLKSDSGVQQSQIDSLHENNAESNFQRSFFNISKLLDICAIYGRDNQWLTTQLVKNAFSINNGLFDDLANTVPVISNTVRVMEQRCMSTSQMQLAAKPHERSSFVASIRQELSEVLDFLSDAVISFCTFVDVYPEAAVILALAGNQSDSENQILLTLELIHDSLIPLVQKCFFHLQGSSKDIALESSIEIRLKRLRFQLIDLVWKLFFFSYLKKSSYADSQETYVNYLLEMNVCDPKARGEGFVQILSRMVEEPSTPFTEEIAFSGGLLRNVNRKYKLLEMVRQLCNEGLMFLDSAQYDYITAIISHTATSSSVSLPNHADLVPITHGVSDIDVVNESKISHIKDIFPDYGVGFIAACLEAYDENTEDVIQRILEGTLHPSLQSLDTALEVKPASRNVSFPIKVKGKGKIDEAHSQHPKKSLNAQDGIQKTRWDGEIDGVTQRLSSSMSASTSAAVGNDSTSNIPGDSDFHFDKDVKGRFIRKDKGEESVRAVPNERVPYDAIRAAAFAAQYEDEYDDSFDDLGTSIADGVEEAESLVDLARPKSSAGAERGLDQNSRISGGGRSAGVGKGPWPTNNGLSQEIRSNPYESNSSAAVKDSQRKGQPPMSRNRGRGRRNEPRAQFYVRDGVNYSYKVAGSVAVANAEAAEALERRERETIYGLGQGGNVPVSGNEPAHSLPRPSNSNPAREESSGHASRGRGRGPLRRDHNHHNRKDRSMQKHFASLGSM